MQVSNWMGDCPAGCSSITMLYMQVNHISTKSPMHWDIIMTYHISRNMILTIFDGFSCIKFMGIYSRGYPATRRLLGYNLLNRNKNFVLLLLLGYQLVIGMQNNRCLQNSLLNISFHEVITIFRHLFQNL